jgi:iron complex transport system ATP-binding protein
VGSPDPLRDVVTHADAPAVLELHDASVLREGARVLDHVTLTIRAGEHTAIVGPNGSGKSSLIKLLTREYYPLATPDGVPPVRVFGQSEWDVFELRTRMGIVSADLHARFLDGAVHGRTRALAAVISGFFASQGIFTGHRVSPEMRELAADALRRMDALHLANRPLNHLSTGEVRRVLIARALVNQPAVLVLDEPTTGLDLVMRHRFMERVRMIAAEGTTVVLVTHHLDEIFPEVGRVVLLRRGGIAYDGPKAGAMKTGPLSTVYEASISIAERAGYYHAVLEE